MDSVDGREGVRRVYGMAIWIGRSCKGEDRVLVY